MPAYDYRCTECGESFEVTRPMGSSTEEQCPACGAPAKRVFSPVGVAFKGSGFHNTDYKSRPKEEGPPASEGGCASKSDSPACASCPSANAS